MPDTQYKQTTLPASAESPSTLQLSDPSELLRPPWVKASRAQNTVLGARRAVTSRHMGGSDEWLVDSSTPGGASQKFPDPDAWREVLRSRFEMLPGQVLVGRCLAVPSGATEIKPVGLPWKQHGVQGQSRFSVTWTDHAGATTSETALFNPSASPNADGSEDTDTGSAWLAVEHLVVPVVRPSGAGLTLATTEQWSEYVTVEVITQDRGGARIIHATLSEEPANHVALHSDTAVSVNGAGPNWPTKYPQEDHEDGATYEENRYSTRQALRVAERQTERVGPKIAAWGSYAESLAEVDDLVPDTVTTPSTTYVRVSAGPNTAWDADAVGFDIMASARAPENLSTRVSGAASCPVRVRVYCKFNTTGSNTASFKLQSSPRSLVEIPISQTTIGTTLTMIEVTGWLECNIASDDGYAKIQDFYKTSGDTLEIAAWDVSYGAYAVGV